MLTSGKEKHCLKETTAFLCNQGRLGKDQRVIMALGSLLIRKTTNLLEQLLKMDMI